MVIKILKSAGRNFHFVIVIIIYVNKQFPKIILILGNFLYNIHSVQKEDVLMYFVRRRNYTGSKA